MIKRKKDLSANLWEYKMQEMIVILQNNRRKLTKSKSFQQPNLMNSRENK
jgi:hypothetical protein